jgi:hypothetical protein
MASATDTATRLLPGAATAESIGDSHALVYQPPLVIRGGAWEVVPRAIYEEWCASGRVPGHNAPVVIVAPAAASAAELAPLVAGIVGYPVTLALITDAARLRRFGRWHYAPVYYVSPAGRL